MSSGAHLSRDFFELVKSIGESKSKQEEDRIIQREVVTLKKLYSTGKHKPRKRVEMLVRLLYVEMLGHDASFGYIHAVQMTAGANLVHKKTAYLVSGQTLHPGHEMRFMMVNVSKTIYFLIKNKQCAIVAEVKPTVLIIFVLNG
jgi:AP-4 complex subunit epsilon-1